MAAPGARGWESQLLNTEPQLKYEALAGDLPSLLEHDSASCLCVSDKLVVVGTAQGAVHLLDHCGNKVGAGLVHKGRVCCCSLDEAEEALASCSDDGVLMVSSVFGSTDGSSSGPAPWRHKVGLQAVALDPRYSRRKRQDVAVAGADGSISLISSGWLGRGETLLSPPAAAASSSSGSSQVGVALRWLDSWLVWGRRSGEAGSPGGGGLVAVYDSLAHRVVGTLAPHRAAGSAGTPTPGGSASASTMQQQQQTPPRRPGSAEPLHAAAPALSMTAFGSACLLHIGWGAAVQVVRLGRAADGATPEALQTLAYVPMPPGAALLGVAPMSGRHFASLLLVDSSAEPGAVRASGQPQSGADEDEALAGAGLPDRRPSYGGGAPLQQLQLHTFSWQGALLGVEDIPLTLVMQPDPQQPPTSGPGAASGAQGIALAAVLPSPSSTLPGAWLASGGGGGSSSGSSARSSISGLQDLAAGSSSKLSSPSAAQRATPRSLAPLVASSSSMPSPQQQVAPRDSTYMLLSPRGLLAGRPREPADRIAWLLASGSYEEALALLEQEDSAGGGGAGGGGHGAVSSSSSSTVGGGSHAGLYEEVVTAYLEHCFAQGQLAAAAQLCARLLCGAMPSGSAGLWERWVLRFCAARAASRLAPCLPVGAAAGGAGAAGAAGAAGQAAGVGVVQLRPECYQMVLRALLVDPCDWALLRRLVVDDWPPGLYSLTALAEAVALRLRALQPPGGSPRPSRSGQEGEESQDEAAAAANELWQLLSWLYQQQGRLDLALAIHLQLRSATAFDFITQHGLQHLLPGRAAALLDIDGPRGAALLLDCADVVPPSEVVAGLQARLQEASASGDAHAATSWRRCLHQYLYALHQADATACAEHGDLLVALTAEFAPSRLQDLLTSCQSYDPEAALAVCQGRGLLQESVYLLGRLGAAGAALRVIIDELADLPRAIQFARAADDEELWETLIEWALRSPDTTGTLLDNLGGLIHPRRVLLRLPDGMPIPALADRLRAILADYRTSASLRQGCNAILRTDCSRAMARLYAMARAAVPVANPTHGAVGATRQTAAGGCDNGYNFFLEG